MFILGIAFWVSSISGLIFGVVEFLFTVSSYREVLVLLRGSFVVCG